MCYHLHLTGENTETQSDQLGVYLKNDLLILHCFQKRDRGGSETTKNILDQLWEDNTSQDSNPSPLIPDPIIVPPFHEDTGHLGTPNA